VVGLSRPKKWSVETVEPRTAIKVDTPRNIPVSINNNDVMINYSVGGVIVCELGILGLTTECPETRNEVERVYYRTAGSLVITREKHSGALPERCLSGA
jgi:hypothetical protein